MICCSCLAVSFNIIRFFPFYQIEICAVATFQILYNQGCVSFQELNRISVFNSRQIVDRINTAFKGAMLEIIVECFNQHLPENGIYYFSHENAFFWTSNFATYRNHKYDVIHCIFLTKIWNTVIFKLVIICYWTSFMSSKLF